jgi:hypothetical protein
MSDDKKLYAGIDHGNEEGSKEVVSVVDKNGNVYPIGQLQSLDFKEFCEKNKDAVLQGFQVPKKIWELPADFNLVEAITRRRVYEMRIEKMRFATRVWYSKNFYQAVLGKNYLWWYYGRSRNPPMWILRKWCVWKLSWTNRKFKRTPISVIKKLWRKKWERKTAG